MNKIEHAVLKGIKNSLVAQGNHIRGDNWEDYARRMQTTVRSAVDVINELLALEVDESKKEGYEDEGIKLSL